MNLTKLFVAGLCFTAMTASAVVIKSDSFESGFSSGWDGTPAGARVDGTNGVAEANSPINTTDTKVVQLNTEGGVWTNQVGYSFDKTNTAALYVDMLVKFVPSETLPELGADVKLAIATTNAVTNSVLVVTKAIDGVNVWASTTTTIDTSLWYRVTVKLEQGVDFLYYASITLNSNQPVFVGNQSRFEIADSTYFGVLNSIGFQGTGYIDEVVVRNDDPLGGSTIALLTLSFSTGELSVLVSGTGTNAAPVVPSGTTLDVVAKMFYEIAGKSGVTNEWTSLGVTNGTIKVSADDDATVTFTARPWTSTTPVGGTTDFATQPSTNVAAWAIENGVSTLSDGIYTNYLYNIDDAATVPNLLIKSIAVTNPIVTVTVEAGTVDLSGINGTLKVKAYPTLGGTPEIYYSSITNGTTTATLQVNIGTNKFVKALIE